MSDTKPSYLRVHRGPRRASHRHPVNRAGVLDQFWQAYTEATGWRIDRRRPGKPAQLQVLPAIVSDGMLDSEQQDAIPAVSRSGATKLARAAARLSKQLQDATEAIRRQEAELAARAAVLPSDASREALAGRLDEILADAAAACGCDAAAMYLLDDDTRYLSTRAVFNLPEERLGASPRELKGCRGDLEAFVQNVVMRDDVRGAMFEGDELPEDFAAGICASINDGELPIGTLWLYAEEPTSFGRAEAAAARLAASLLAAELARAARTTDRSVRIDQRAAIRDVAQWQHRTLPAASKLAHGWTADGMIESNQDWATGWHSWDILPDGSLMIAIAEAVDASMSGAMTAAAARSALAAHCGYRHSPRQLIERIGDTLWQSNSGDQLLSLLYARIDLDCGQGEVATAGKLQAMIANRYGFRPLIAGTSEPLGTRIDSRCVVETFRILPGEVLFAHGPGFLTDGASQELLGQTLRATMRTAGDQPLAAIRRALADRPIKHERGAVTLIRSCNSPKSLSEKGSDPLRRDQNASKIDSPPKGQTPFRIGSKSPG